MSLLVHIVLMCCAIVLRISGQAFEFQPSDETQRFHNSSGNFRWKNCDGNGRALNFIRVDMKPDPLILTGENVTMKVLLWFNLTTVLGDNKKQIEVDLSLRLKTPDGDTEICELVGERICHYNDLCAHLSRLTKDCKKYKLDWCECPFEPKLYQTPPLTIPVEPLPFLLKGTFDGTVFVKQEGKDIGCLELHFCVTECSKW